MNLGKAMIRAYKRVIGPNQISEYPQEYMRRAVEKYKKCGGTKSLRIVEEHYGSRKSTLVSKVSEKFPSKNEGRLYKLYNCTVHFVIRKTATFQLATIL